MIGLINKERKAVAFAIQGIVQFIRKEKHALIHLVATISTLLLSYFTKVT